MRSAATALTILLLSACAIGQDIRVSLPPHQPAPGASRLAAAPPQTFQIEPFRERGGTGVLPGRVGERQTIGHISLGQVTLDPAPGQVVADAFAAELRAAGHRPGTGSDTELSGEIRRFQLRTDVTPLYWDVVLDAEVLATLRRGGVSASATYARTCRERTYVWPGESIIARVVGTCLAELAGQFRQDREMPHVLGAR